MKERGKAASLGSPWALAWATSWTVRKKAAGTRKWRHAGAGRAERKEGGGPAGRPPGRLPDLVNNSHRRTEDSPAVVHGGLGQVAKAQTSGGDLWSLLSASQEFLWPRLPEKHRPRCHSPH